MTPFEKWKDKYEKNWVTMEQLKRLVELSVLTESEYEEITGKTYSV
jgi:uncharacterized XkdX family phage protein